MTGESRTGDVGHGSRWHPRAKEPAPQPKPTTPPPRSVFESRGVMTTYGMVDGSLPAARVCELAAQHGYSYVAAQLYEDNRPFLDDLRNQCHAHGLKFGLWDAEPSPLRCWLFPWYQADLVILESEGAQTDWAYIASQFHPSMPWAVVTNLSGLDDHVLQNAGAALLVECYVQDNPNATPARMVAAGRARGYQTVIPVPGVYHEKPLKDYMPLDSFCVYAAEYMSEADWAV